MDRTFKLKFNIDEDILIVPEVETFTKDNNIFNICLELYKNGKTKELQIKKTELKDYKVELFVCKPPMLKEWVSCIGEVDEENNRINFPIDDTFTDTKGAYKCELRISHDEQMLITQPFIYRVNGSVTDGAIKEEKVIINKIEPKVINNLITTNSEVALSARQGYILNERITEVVKELNARIDRIFDNQQDLK